MKTDILISTYNEGILKVGDITCREYEDVEYKIAHQISDATWKTIPQELIRDDIEIKQAYEAGLSKNRNMSIGIATGDICFIADDDVRYYIEEIKKVVDIFSNNPDVDIVVGKIRTPEGQPDYKKYSTHRKRLRINSIGSVSSIEIAFRLKRVIDNRIEFDERFGIGGMYSKGEEVIFLADCLRKGLKIVYYPIPFVCHEYRNPGNEFQFDKDAAKYYGALMKRIFGSVSYLFPIIVWYRHYKKYRENLNWNIFVRAFYSGIRSIQADWSK